ncbi:MAG: NAD-dependent protein deacylase [Caldisericia bacterium]|nr:NAD-dependent protein deacylase [Caldisericia bacterium]
MNSDLQKLKNLIESSYNIVALTGAGISTNAGIPDFRGPMGIYTTKRYDPEKTFDINYFFINPQYFYDFARDFITLLEKVEPTFTHKFLAKLEKSGKLKGVITQNIDMLHERAGSKVVITLHGSIEKSYCLNCEKEYSLNQMKEKIKNEKIPKCDICDGLIKPNIVFFGESVHDFDKAIELTNKSDLLLVIGTSLKVYPASYIPNYASGKIVIVNKGDISLKQIKYDLYINSDIDEVFRELDEILNLEV